MRLHEQIKPKKLRRPGTPSPDQTMGEGANRTGTAPRKVSGKGLPLADMAARREVLYAERPFVAMPGKDPAHVARIAAAIRRMFAGIERQPGDTALLDSVTSLHVRTEPPSAPKP